RKKIYVGFGNRGIAVVNALDRRQVSSIKLTGHPEVFVLERYGKRIFVNVPTSRQVVVIDRDKGEVSQRGALDLPSEIFRWRWMKIITGFLLGAVFHPNSLSSTPNRGSRLRKSTSPVIPMMFSTTASPIASMRYVAQARSTSSNKPTRTTTKL